MTKGRIAMRAKVLVFAGVVVWITTMAWTTAATSDDRDDESRIREGFQIAPVHLNLNGKNRALVGLGSYLVNGPGDCNGCHSGPSGQFLPGGDPAQGQPKMINQAARYRSGSRASPVWALSSGDALAGLSEYD